MSNFFFDQNDQKSFASQAKSLIKFKADGILFTPLFPVESTQLIETIEKARIPYVLINSDIPERDTLCYIGAEIFTSGYLAGQLVHYCIDESQKVLVANITAEIDNNYAILRKEEGFMSYFKNNNLSNDVLSFNTTQTSYSSFSKKLSALRTKNFMATITSYRYKDQASRFQWKIYVQAYRRCCKPCMAKGPGIFAGIRSNCIYKA